MASSAERLAPAALWLATAAAAFGCSQGQGEGSVTGTLTVADCGLRGAAFDLAPDYFSAELVEDRIELRVQHGSDLDIYSDGLRLSVRDVTEVRRSMLGMPLEVGPEGSPVTATLYLNDTCRPTRRDVPRVLVGAGGTVVFDAIYAPAIDDEDRAIRATIPELTLTDPADPDARFGTITGWFDFFYQRGRPSQRYP